MGASQDTSTADTAQPSNLPPHYENDATLTPRDIKRPPPSQEEFDSLWRITSQADNSEPAPRKAPAAANATGSTAPYAAAAQRVKTQNAQTCAQAALMLNAPGGGEPVPDHVVANFFHVPQTVVADSREQFRYAYNRSKSIQALAGCPVLSSAIVQNPSFMPLVRNQVAPLAKAEQALSPKPTVGGVLYEAAKGFGGFGNHVLKVLSLAAAAPLIGVDRVGSWITGKDDTSLEDAWFGATTKPVDDNQADFGYDPSTGRLGKVAHSVGTLAGMVPYMYLTGGEGSAAGFLPRLAQSAGRMAVPSATEGVSTANDVYADTGSGSDAAKAGAMVTATTVAQGALPLSLPGRMAARLPSAALLGVAGGEASRRLNNAALPENMQQPFNSEDAEVNAIVSSLLTTVPSIAQYKATNAWLDSLRLRTVSEAANTPLRETHPAMFRQLLRNMSDGSDLQTLYVDGKTFKEILSRHNISMDELAAKMPDVAKQIDDAIKHNGYVSIPVEEYAMYMAGSPMDADILRNFKSEPDPDAMTAGQAQEAIQQQSREAASTGRTGYATAPSESQKAVGASGTANAASSAKDTQAGDGQPSTAAATGHPLANPEQWGGYQKELQGMSPENRAMAERFADKLRDYHAAVAEYAGLKDSHGGKVLNTDVARELSPDYLKDRTKSQVVHTLASAFVRKMYAEKLAATREPMVLFSAGGPGAGKSTVLDGNPRWEDDADIVYDTTMSHYGSAKGMIGQALDAGGEAHVVLVIREPTDALLNGVIRRAVKQEKQYGSGRTVKLDYFLSAQPAAIRNVFRLADVYRDNPNVQFTFMDNTHGFGNTKEVSLEQAKQIEFQQVEARAMEILEQEYRDGKISKEIYTGVKQGFDVTGRTR